MNPVYIAGPHSTIPANKFEVVVRELEKIQQKEGILTAESVVAAATPARSPLHELFIWNDQAAASRFRLIQARLIIRSVQVVIQEREDVPAIRAFVSVTPIEDEIRFDSRGYRSSMTVLREPAYREQLLERAKRDLQSWKERYEHLEEFSKIINAINETVS